MPSDFKLTKALLLNQTLLETIIEISYFEPDKPRFVYFGLQKTSEFDNEESLLNVLSNFNLSEDLTSEISSEFFKEKDVRHY